jgi:hypothetical protein
MFLFGLLGPAIGNVLMVILACITAALADTSSGSGYAQITVWVLLFSLLVGGLPFAYLYGLAPALVTGAIYSLLTSRVDGFRGLDKRWHAIASAAIGATASACAVAWLEASLSSLENFHFYFVAVGAVSAFLIGHVWPRPDELSNNAYMDSSRK